MTDAANPFAAVIAQMQEMAKAMPQATADPAADFDAKSLEAMWPTMPKEVMEMWFGKSGNQDGLDAKTRMLLTLAGLTMQGAQAETPMRQTVRHAREAGATDQEITDTLGMMALFAGMPAVTRATTLAQEVMDEDKDKT
ncbi:MAG: carboxymuconolactone decarboxylase family protein [Tateyamaria sp.]|uniref:carboxymuconolactone decarboxylase family protein n=1 Tax=Tateyamaria sp. TaxID=1929288 RepID=UPI00328DF92E